MKTTALVLAATAALATTAFAFDIEASADAHIRADNTTQASNGQQLIAGDLGSSTPFHVLMNFDLSAPEISAGVSDVTFSLRKDANDSSSTGTAITLEVYQLIGTFNEAATWETFSGNPLSEWNVDGANGAGTDYNTTLLASYTGTQGDVAVGGSFNFTSTADFTTAINNNIAGSINLLIRVTPQADRQLFRFASSEDPLVGPTLSLTAVPEPSSYALIAGFLALGSIMIRRRG